ncbi:MAG: glucosamine-6-phosphate deaminase [Limnochordales bacterium]|nr:glucosamine-6-phosphate deaminase [Limnochordales bacterium]
MGAAAAARVAEALRQTLAARSGPHGARIIFAAAPSQNEFLHFLQQEGGIDWSRVVGFHLDEYLGLPADAPQSFRTYLRNHIITAVKPGVMNWINGECADPAAECERYARLLDSSPLDVACVGIGENGHLAFNDPPVADFADPVSVKVVELDPRDRQQQVNDGCFPDLEAVPRYAITVTIPPIMRSRFISCVVPGPRKAEAVRAALTGPITTDCPASILRRHPNAVLFLDEAAASLLTL